MEKTARGKNQSLLSEIQKGVNKSVPNKYSLLSTAEALETAKQRFTALDTHL